MTDEQYKKLEATSEYKQREWLIKLTPAIYRPHVTRLIDASGLGKHDLALPHLLLEVQKLRRHEEMLEVFSTSQKAMEQKVSELNKDLSETVQRLRTGYARENASMEMTWLKKWMDWVVTPQGVTLTVLVVLALLGLIF